MTNSSQQSSTLLPENRLENGTPALPAAMAANCWMALNSFQLFMKQWTRLGPYSAGQAMRISGPPELARCRRAANLLVNHLRLGVPEFMGDRVYFRPTVPVEVHVSGDSLETTAARQLNVPFAASDLPVRFFIISAVDPPEPTGPVSHWVLVMYDHWLFDSSAMREFMRLLAEFYLQPNAPPAPPSLHFSTQEIHEQFPGMRRASLPLADIMRGLKCYIQHRRAWRVNLENPVDFSVGLKIQTLPDGLITALAVKAKSSGASVNDLFLAAMAQCMEILLRQKTLCARGGIFGPRNKLALGTIVDMRHLARVPLDNVLGLFLSYCTTMVNARHTTHNEDLIRRISRQTRKFKSTGQAIGVFRTLDVARFFWRFYDQPRHHALFFQKNTPVIAGVSNVNLQNEWMCARPSPIADSILDFVRISPTGPLLPLVFTLTTTSAKDGTSRLGLCLTWRKTAISEAIATEIAADFIHHLQDLAK